MNLKRRIFLKGAVLGSALLPLIQLGLLKPTAVLAGNWPGSAFKSKKVAEIKQQLFGDRRPVKTKKISIIAPFLAEDGLLVPIKISTDIEKVKSIVVIVEKNPHPLASIFHISQQGRIYMELRLKMAKSSNLLVFADTGDQVYQTSRLVRVTVGGCGR